MLKYSVKVRIWVACFISSSFVAFHSVCFVFLFLFCNFLLINNIVHSGSLALKKNYLQSKQILMYEGFWCIVNEVIPFEAWNYCMSIWSKTSWCTGIPNWFDRELCWSLTRAAWNVNKALQRIFLYKCLADCKFNSNLTFLWVLCFILNTFKKRVWL